KRQCAIPVNAADEAAGKGHERDERPTESEPGLVDADRCSSGLAQIQQRPRAFPDRVLSADDGWRTGLQPDDAPNQANEAKRRRNKDQMPRTQGTQVGERESRAE